MAWLSDESGRNFILLKVVFLSGNVPSSEDSSIFSEINFYPLTDAKYEKIFVKQAKKFFLSPSLCLGN